MDPELQTLAVQLVDVGLRNSASAIADKVGTAKARKKDGQTIAELEEIVSGLLSDKSDLVRIAQAYEEQIVSQRISADEISYISDTLVPLLKELAGLSPDPDNMDEVIDKVAPLLSVEFVTILQAFGFNFRRALGEPLTAVVAQLIRQKMPSSAGDEVELRKLNIERELQVLRIAQDPEAHERLQRIYGN